jgi:hypothetical protein
MLDRLVGQWTASELDWLLMGRIERDEPVTPAPQRPTARHGRPDRARRQCRRRQDSQEDPR